MAIQTKLELYKLFYYCYVLVVFDLHLFDSNFDKCYCTFSLSARTELWRGAADILWKFHATDCVLEIERHCVYWSI